MSQLAATWASNDPARARLLRSVSIGLYLFLAGLTISLVGAACGSSTMLGG